MWGRSVRGARPLLYEPVIGQPGSGIGWGAGLAAFVLGVAAGPVHHQRMRAKNVAPVRNGYEYFNQGWLRATVERRAALIGHLELLSLNLPAVVPDDWEREEIIAWRADILGLVNQITVSFGACDSAQRPALFGARSTPPPPGES